MLQTLLVEIIIISSLFGFVIMKYDANEQTLDVLERQNDMAIINYLKVHKDTSSFDENICYLKSGKKREDLNNVNDCFNNYNGEYFYQNDNNTIKFKNYNSAQNDYLTLPIK